MKVLIPSAKNEPLNVDLNTSMPPASPSDDPLLLSGPVVLDGDSGPTLMIFVDLDQKRLILIQRPNLRGPILLIWMKTVFLSLVIEKEMLSEARALMSCEYTRQKSEAQGS